MSAVFSECGQYRYRLDRVWDEAGPRAVWCMLNPSDAGEEKNDPTTVRCIGFSQAWGYGSLTLINPFALIATDPRQLLTHPDPVGPDNDLHIGQALDGAGLVVAAWGQSWPKAHALRIHRFGKLLAGRAYHLGLTKTGQPMHPLYRPAATQLQPWGAVA